MLDINLIRENPDLVKDALKKRQDDPTLIDRFLEEDTERRALVTKVEMMKAERNAGSKEISKTKSEKERQTMIESMRKLGEEIGMMDAQVKTVDDDLQKMAASLPNIPDDRVPVGVGEQDNKVVKTFGQIPEFEFTPLAHWDLGPKLGLIDFERGIKLTGSRFYVLSGAGARFQRALIAWMLDLHIRQGYTEKYTPFMVRSEILFAAGQLPKFADNLYHDVEEDFWWVPTAEVPLTGMHLGEVISENDLPLRYTAYTPCFRREKMSAGRDVRGIKRGHQFDKVEMYIYCKPEESENEHQKMLEDARQTCEQLGLTHRIVQQCTGDLSFASRITYDLEVWAPGCGEWLEVSSVSNVGDFQSRRANIKSKPIDGGKANFLHTLNGSGLGLPRTLISVLETYQQKDGSIKVPEVLLPWMGGIEIIK